MGNMVQNKIFVIITGAIVIIYIGLGIYGVGNANRLNDLYEESYKNSIEVGSHTIELYGDFLGIQNLLQESLNGQSEESIRYGLNSVNEEGLKIQKTFSQIKSVGADKFDQSSGLLEVILEEFQTYEIAKDDAYEMLNNGELIKCQNHIRLVLIPTIKAITINLKIFVDAENDEVIESYVEYSNVTEYIRIQVWVGGVLLVVFLAYASIYFIKNRKIQRERSFIEKEEYRITIDAIVEGVLILDTELKIHKINKIAEKLTGWTSEAANGNELASVFNIMDEENGESINRNIRTLVLSEDVTEVEQSGVLLARDHQKKTITYNNSCIKDIYGKTIGYVVAFRDIGERRKKEKAIYFMTYHDQVTCINNRAYFEEQKDQIEKEINYPISVIQGDINGLKFINDAFGHFKGDELLKNAAEVLMKNSRETDIVCRTGGDEFTILMPNTSNEEAHRIVSIIEAEILLMEQSTDKETFFISIALGCATMKDPSESIKDVIKRADDYMYKKKLIEKDSLHSSLLKSIRKTLEEKSHETEAHASRLVDLSKQLGSVLKLANEKLYELELLSNLHDIGKIGIPNQILNKKGPLTAAEWVEMKKHPEIGFRIAQSTIELSGIASYILCHHERWDGKGYPGGMVGEKIPLLSRIISVVDAYDAMTDDRIYRKGMSKEAALEEIKCNAGSQFDPNIAKSFVEMMEANEIK